MDQVFRLLSRTIGLVAISIIAGVSGALDKTLKSGDLNQDLPPGWDFVGCYTDQASSRTLRAQSFVNTTAMTPALCIEFCGPDNFFPQYGFAELNSRRYISRRIAGEIVKLIFEKECFCDGIIQVSANLTDPSECNLPCKGDNNLSCGGSNRISVFTDGTPSPKITTAGAVNHGPNELLGPFWQYVGCYSDNPMPNRTLQFMTPIAGLQDINTCVPACLNAFSGQIVPTIFAGSEFGGECWCGTSVAPTAQRLPDVMCESMGCLDINDQACGGSFIMTIYQLLQLEFTPVSACNLNLPQPGPFFHLEAVFLDDPSQRLPITMTSIVERQVLANNGFGLVTKTEAGILSACLPCPEAVVFNLTGLVLIPNLDSSTSINNNTAIHPGGAVNFVEITDRLTTFGEYCIAPSRFNSTRLALTTAFLPQSGVFSAPNAVLDPTIPWTLCSNGTAGGRLDVVLKEFLLVPGFNLTDCRDVELQIIES